MNGRERIDRLHLNHYHVFNQQIEPVADIESYFPVEQRQRHLCQYA